MREKATVVIIEERMNNISVSASTGADAGIW